MNNNSYDNVKNYKYTLKILYLNFVGFVEGNYLGKEKLGAAASENDRDLSDPSQCMCRKTIIAVSTTKTTVLGEYGLQIKDRHLPHSLCKLDCCDSVFTKQKYWY